MRKQNVDPAIHANQIGQSLSKFSQAISALASVRSLSVKLPTKAACFQAFGCRLLRLSSNGISAFLRFLAPGLPGVLLCQDSNWRGCSFSRSPIPHLISPVYRALAGLGRAGHPAHCREPCSRVLVPDEHRRIGGGEQHRLGWLLKSWHR